jgi:hypothetical protein
MTDANRFELSPKARRAPRGGPRTQAVRPARGQPRSPDTRPDGQAPHPLSEPRRLAEWHEMTPGEQVAEWAALRAWVAWLYDRYELATEDRLPRCWASHPGLVEELYALKAWREEIYSAPQPSGQAARYWHAELRQVLHAATTLYAAGCRTGHRGAPRLAAPDARLREQWANAYPLAGIPGIDIAAGRARRVGELASTAAIAGALDDGKAALPDLTDYVAFAGAWWAPAACGWVQVPEPALAAPLEGAEPGRRKDGITGTEPWGR